MAKVHGRVGEDHGGAVGRERIVEAGVFPQLVDVVAHVVEENAAVAGSESTC